MAHHLFSKHSDSLHREFPAALYTSRMRTKVSEHQGVGRGGSVRGQRDPPGSGLGGRYKGHCGDPLSHNSTLAECQGTLGGFGRSGTHPAVEGHHSCGVPIRGAFISSECPNISRESIETGPQTPTTSAGTNRLILTNLMAMMCPLRRFVPNESDNSSSAAGERGRRQYNAVLAIVK